ncbi:MAG: FAD-dependent thymidylate synthase [Candidatus Krumholzibacteria bacterium]|nr:FAD-dependent thymidylate synthase [Candidatus Krumholzibacteria bacterium]
MRIVLAGFNIEAEGINLLNKETGQVFTPEVIAASYARISRDSRSVGALRREARKEVEQARRSNETIVFGLGHASIAEHAVFNFDVMQVSRFAVEEIERFRLASFTEKSQRYIRLGRDLVVPEEIKENGFEKRFLSVIRGLHDAYKEILIKITGSGEKEGVAKEDARYLMPLATSTQLGMTVNARELEYMISRMASHPLREMQVLSCRLCKAARKISPSLIRYPEPTTHFIREPSIRKEIAKAISAKAVSSGFTEDDVRLIDVTPNGDMRLAACIIFSCGGVTMDQAMKAAARLDPPRIKELVSKVMRHIQPHESVWREFENIHLLFEVIVSASCYAQIKRHRMATLVPQPYDVSLGISIPASVGKAKAVGFFRKNISRSEQLYRSIYKRTGPAAAYALTNAHRRRVLIDINLRELYHFSRLRSDRHSQWEIRSISDKMCRLASRKVPVGSMLLCGKDNLAEKKNKILLKI